MNLNALVAPIVAAINPWTCASFEQSTNYSTAVSGKRAPVYAAAVAVSVQSQALTYKDLMQLSGVNQGGEKRAMYVDADWKGVDRATARGGDLITLPDASVWLVTQVLENWHDIDGWVKVAVTKQNNA